MLLPTSRAVAVAAVSLALTAAACTATRHSSAGSAAPPTTSSAPVVGPATPTSAVRTAPPATPSRTPARIPPVSAQARADGLIDVRTIVPDAIIDLRYATTDNFTHVQLYPRDARCLVHLSMAPGLEVAAARLRSAGDVLVFWDCYRPHSVQVRMFAVVPDPDWVARPTTYARSHETGRSVDVTLARAVVGPCPSGQRDHRHCLLDMGTGFDDFTPRAHAYATQDVSAVAQSDRALLRTAMAAGGLTVYSGEWWHFDGPGALDPRPVLAAPVD